MPSLATLLHSLDSFQPQDSWVQAEDLLAELWEHGPPADALVPLFRFLERFPVDESGGVLMGLMHGIESFPAYETELLDSLHRQPTEITLLLVRRIANTGQKSIAQHPVASVYRAVYAHPTAPLEVKQMAQELLAK
ncbi:hypothetical protein I2I05_20630 [Hymenobacter sp. BT683]|uniref:HEAT repeat domain-containing protein n=1 Tax=Hymenobacter jeongseonensis TaxID=2791027 RepID=A0ABS0IN89_9BACT|nr:hypothetical protein [Hymenobacter jeongseonensis]MBF9239812.1 hypothetical protein [Hymenobacter jeongseonensis]